MALAVIVPGFPAPVPVPVTVPDGNIELKLVALEKGSEVEVTIVELEPVPAGDVMLVTFTEIDGLAERLGLYEAAVPEDAEMVVALTESVKLAEGSAVETAVPTVPTIELVI